MKRANRARNILQVYSFLSEGSEKNSVGTVPKASTVRTQHRFLTRGQAEYPTATWWSPSSAAKLACSAPFPGGSGSSPIRWRLDGQTSATSSGYGNQFKTPWFVK